MVEAKEGMGRMRSVSGKDVYEELGDGGGGGGGVVKGRKDGPCEPMEGWGGKLKLKGLRWSCRLLGERKEGRVMLASNHLRAWLTALSHKN